MCLPLVALAPLAGVAATSAGAAAAGTAVAMTAVSLAATTAATAVNYVSQKAAADAQSKYQAQVYNETAKAARSSLAAGLTDLAAQQVEDAATASDQAEEVRARTVANKATAAVALSERNIKGGSVDELIVQFDQIESKSLLNLSTNLKWATDQRTRQGEGLHAQAKARIAGSAPAPVQQPSLMGAVLQGGAQALSQMDQAYSRLGMLGVGPYKV